MGRWAESRCTSAPRRNGTLEALGAVPLDVSDSLVAFVEIVRQSGTNDTAHLSLRYPHHAPAVAAATSSRARVAGASRLRVDKKFTKANVENDERVEQENELAREVGRHAQDTPQLWSLPFLRPRETRVTSQFGTGRVFNGRVSSSHLGIDYRGKVGEPIFAANRGVVALVSEFFLAGNVVYIDHGDGVVTGYFHMSQPEVVVGDTVERGQEIGQVGATGRRDGTASALERAVWKFDIRSGESVRIEGAVRAAGFDPAAEVRRGSLDRQEETTRRGRLEQTCVLAVAGSRSWPRCRSRVRAPASVGHDRSPSRRRVSGSSRRRPAFD